MDLEIEMKVTLYRQEAERELCWVLEGEAEVS